MPFKTYGDLLSAGQRAFKEFEWDENLKIAYDQATDRMLVRQRGGGYKGNRRRYYIFVGQNSYLKSFLAYTDEEAITLASHTEKFSSTLPLILDQKEREK